jgi:hypothetical protein
MALVPVLTPAELELTEGPTLLARYAGESFSWLHALRRGPGDWNTLIAIRFNADSLRDIGDFFAAPCAPGMPPRHENVRRAAAVIHALADLKAAAAHMCDRLLDAPTLVSHTPPLGLREQAAVVEPRIVQEWEAWLRRLCRHIEQERRITRQVCARLKRSAAAAELADTERPAPVTIEE